MAEVVVNIIAVAILYKEILIAFGHWMRLRDMSNHSQTVGYLAGVIYQDKSVVAYLRPFCGDAMKIASL